MEHIIAYTAGGSRGNPGPAAVGVQITDGAGTVLSEVSQLLGNSTDNFAEYQGVVAALDAVKQLYAAKTNDIQVELRMDAELVKKQLNSESQINEPGLVPLFIQIHNLRVAHFPHLTFTQIRREENQAAHRLVNATLDTN